ncbi:hypothetical protein L1987_65079 [Smallanthus sonchifolius]|uniref:Uncharacterized protein n=1 Tax=Smallanthus sonchifolius TaxID=185202 RepID=A0ACB9BTC4_9ASTR|nr:hypothetical protein L1987_65079 [Smallanthus sonchifolius]
MVEADCVSGGGIPRSDDGVKVVVVFPRERGTRLGCFESEKVTGTRGCYGVVKLGCGLRWNWFRIGIRAWTEKLQSKGLGLPRNR